MTRECPQCSGSIGFLDQSCGICGADLALELEIAAFHEPAINSARRMILFAGFIYPLVPLLLFAMLARLAGGSVFATSAFALSFGVGCAVLAAHVGLWWWAKRSPFPATVIAFGVYLGYLGFTGLASGFVIKIIGFVILLRGVLAANHVRKLRTQHATRAATALAVLTLLVGCYGAAPPRPEAVPLPALVAGTPISVDSESSTKIELVHRKSETCPQGHTRGSQACVVTRYSEREPVTRTSTTATYGSSPLNYAQFQVLTDPAYESKLAALDEHSKACRGANVPRWIGAGLAIGGLVGFTVGASRGNQAATIGGEIAMAAGAGSYVLGYYAFGGKRCGTARGLYRELDLSTESSMTEVAGADLAEEMKRLADEFNVTSDQASSARTAQ